ncbi:patch repair protein [Salmonella enterica subsp. enterica serovar Enteritidis]|nr:patch repair protein [Salmonella enterica subsp. enterica serovar Enteritidis]
MADVHDKATRSKNMRAIATRDTAIEKRLAGLLSAQGITFHTQDATLPGKPDFVVNDYDWCDFLLTAAFGIITTVICSKCRPRERLSGWKKSVRTLSAMSAIFSVYRRLAGGY